MRATRVWTVGLGVVLAAGACGGHLNDGGQSNTQTGGVGNASSAVGTGAESNAIAGGGAGGAHAGTGGNGALVGVGAGGAHAGTGGGVSLVSPGGGEGVITPDGGYDLGDAGETGKIDYPCNSGIGCIVANAGVINALAADDSNVYWTERGTVDNLGNYQNDGRLLRRAFGSETTEVIATGLSGPVGLMLTKTDAYVYLDQVFEVSLRSALARIPLTGGDATVVQLDAQPVNGNGDPCSVCGASSGGTLYFPIGNAIYEIASADTKPTLFTNFIAWSLLVVGDNLVMVGGMPDGQHQSQIWTIPLTGGTPQLVVDAGTSYIESAGSNFYTTENCGNDLCLSSMPLTGGPWRHLPNPWAGSTTGLEISGNLFFHDAIAQGPLWQMYQGTLTDPSTAVVLFSLPGSTAPGWIGTTAGVFWVDLRTLRLRTND